MSCVAGGVFVPSIAWTSHKYPLFDIAACAITNNGIALYLDSKRTWIDPIPYINPLCKEGKRRRDQDYKELKKALKKQNKIAKKGKATMLDSVKKYYKDHEDVLFPLLIVVALDHFFNNGGLREKIVNLAQGLLNGIQDKLLSPGEKNE